MLHVDHSRHAQSPGSSLPGTRVAAHGKRAAPLLARFLLTALGAGASGLFSQPRVRHGATIFQSCRDGAIASWVINQYFRGVKCLAQGHNTAEVGLEPRTSRSGVRHSTTEPSKDRAKPLSTPPETGPNL